MSMIDGIVAKAAEGFALREDDYLDNDGFARCGKCGKRRQTRLLNGVVVPCNCLCDEQKWQSQKDADRRHQEEWERQRMVSAGILRQDVSGASFDADDGKNPKIAICKNYADRWDIAFSKGYGLRLHGAVGTGKSFAARCIAAAVMDRGVGCLVTNVSSIVDGIRCAENPNVFIQDLAGYPLLVIDDIGAERETDYVADCLFRVVDARYRSGKPLIITTNLKPQEFTDTSDLKRQRVYDRIVQMCQPIDFGQEGRRKSIAENRLDDFVKDILSDD